MRCFINLAAHHNRAILPHTSPTSVTCSLIAPLYQPLPHRIYDCVVGCSSSFITLSLPAFTIVWSAAVALPSHTRLSASSYRSVLALASAFASLYRLLISVCRWAAWRLIASSSRSIPRDKSASSRFAASRRCFRYRLRRPKHMLVASVFEGQIMWWYRCWPVLGVTPARRACIPIVSRWPGSERRQLNDTATFYTRKML